MIETLFGAHFKALSADIEKLLLEQGYEQLLVYSGGLKMQFNDDIPYPFRANPFFKMLVPDSANPDCWVVWRAGEKPLLLVFQPEDFWHAVAEQPEGFWVDFFDIHALRQADDARQHFSDTDAGAFLGEINASIDSWNLGERNPGSLVSALNWRRSFKSAFEIACIEKANQASSRGHIAAKRAFYDGASELEISLEFQHGCRQDEYRLAYPSIVGINEHAGILHYIRRNTHRAPAAERHSLLIDAGADHFGYASDVTRTYSYRDDEFGEMVQALDAGQQQLVRDIVRGQNFRDINVLAKHLGASLLKEFGIVNTSPEATLETGLVESFCPHGVCHFLGLQVHDVAGNYGGPDGDIVPPDPAQANFRLMRSVAAGQVFTIEPGIYFIPMLLDALAKTELRKAVNWQKVERFLRYGGLRIEDNIAMTEAGAINLTRTAFAEEYSQ